MSLLETIKDQVAKEWGFKFCLDAVENQSNPYHFSDMGDEVSRRFAHAVAEDALKMAAERAMMLMTLPMDFDTNELEMEEWVTVEQSDIKNLNLRVDKQSILSTPINLEL